MSDLGPPPGYAADPQLEMLWTAPPDLTGKGMGGQRLVGYHAPRVGVVRR